VAERVRQLAARLPDHQVAEQLNEEGFPTATGLPWTLARVRAVRRKHHIPSACPYTTPNCGPRGDGLVKVGEAAQSLGVNRSMITDWFHQGYLQGSQHGSRSALWVRLGEDDLHRLNGAASYQAGMVAVEEAGERLNLDEKLIRDRIEQGRLLPYRLRVDQRCRWFLLPHNPTECDRLGAL